MTMHTHFLGKCIARSNRCYVGYMHMYIYVIAIFEPHAMHGEYGQAKLRASAQFSSHPRPDRARRASDVRAWRADVQTRRRVEWSRASGWPDQLMRMCGVIFHRLIWTDRLKMQAWRRDRRQ